MIAAPTFIIYDALHPFIGFLTIGMTEYFLQGVFLFLMCCIVRGFKWRYLLSFLVAFIYGNILDLWILIFGAEPCSEIYLRWIFFVLSTVLVALGVAFFFRTYLPLQVYELFVAEVSSRYQKNINKVKMTFDLCLLALSLILVFSLNYADLPSFEPISILYSDFHHIGLGTAITAAVNAPIIALWGKLIDKFSAQDPIFPRFKNFLLK